MYPPPPSSSSSMPQRPGPGGGLIRYGSAPGSFLTGAVDSVLRADCDLPALGSASHSVVGHQYFSADSSSVTSESTCKVNSSSDQNAQPKRGLQRSYGLNEISHGAGSLVRQKSSPAGFLSHLTAENAGFSITRGSPSHTVSRLSSQLSFTERDSLSQISEVSENCVEGIGCDNNHQNSTHSYPTTRFGVDSWDNAYSIVFSGPTSKRVKNVDDGFFNCPDTLETQFSVPQTTLEMAAVGKLLHIPEDSIPCKDRAKRGCATHPRSIAERERRTRISGKLKKLQELVPHMDKQTSYADMLDLAVQHIKGLQNEVQVRNHSS
uniref:Transcription factor bHLH128-like n=1 Tax=Rhizophora mucronata TaxID=61149 RepID=A0A2P2MFW4_RHIMU